MKAVKILDVGQRYDRRHLSLLSYKVLDVSLLTLSAFHMGFGPSAGSKKKKKKKNKTKQKPPMSAKIWGWGAGVHSPVCYEFGVMFFLADRHSI